MQTCNTPQKPVYQRPPSQTPSLSPLPLLRNIVDGQQLVSGPLSDVSSGCTRPLAAAASTGECDNSEPVVTCGSDGEAAIHAAAQRMLDYARQHRQDAQQQQCMTHSEVAGHVSPYAENQSKTSPCKRKTGASADCDNTGLVRAGWSVVFVPDDVRHDAQARYYPGNGRVVSSPIKSLTPASIAVCWEGWSACVCEVYVAATQTAFCPAGNETASSNASTSTARDVSPGSRASPSSSASSSAPGGCYTRGLLCVTSQHELRAFHGTFADELGSVTCHNGYVSSAIAHDVGAEPSPASFPLPSHDATNDSTARLPALTVYDRGRVVMDAWFLDGYPHSFNGFPAIEWAEWGNNEPWKGREWGCFGQRHRPAGLPAVLTDKRLEYWVNGARHQTGGLPAVVNSDGTCQYWVCGVQSAISPASTTSRTSVVPSRRSCRSVDTDYSGQRLPEAGAIDAKALNNVTSAPSAAQEGNCDSPRPASVTATSSVLPVTLYTWTRDTCVQNTGHPRRRRREYAETTIVSGPATGVASKLQAFPQANADVNAHTGVCRRFVSIIIEMYLVCVAIWGLVFLWQVLSVNVTYVNAVPAQAAWTPAPDQVYNWPPVYY